MSSTTREARRRRAHWPWSPELDPLELRFRLDTVPAAVWTTVLLCPAALIYTLTLVKPANRLGLSALITVAFCGSPLLLTLPWGRMARTRWRELLYLVWWLGDFAAIIAATILAGGVRSPLLLFLFVQLVFTGLSYPRAAVAALSLVTLASFAALSLIYRERLAVALVQGTALCATGVMSYWQTRNHNRRRLALIASEHELGAALEQAERGRLALARSEQWLAEAQAIAHVGSWEWELDGDRMTISAELAQILDGAPGAHQRTFEHYVERVHPSDRRAVRSVVRDALAGSGAFSLEHRIQRPDGEIRSVLLRGEVIRDAEVSAGARGVCQDITELRTVETRLRRQLERDPLTGLYNRQRLVKEIDRQLGYGPPAAHRGAVILLDVDGFGFFNDSYGQPAGDELLKSLASALSRRLRASDVVARSGGDEFALVIADATESDAVGLVDELRALLSDCAPGSPITLSVGIAPFSQNFELVGDDVLVAADIALHEAKLGGGNQAVVYRGQVGTDLTLVQEIRAALREDRLVLHGQPIRDVKTGEIVHRELLVRMLNQEGHVVAPASFLPAAERFGLINAIDRWVVGVALELASQGMRVAVNLSALSIGDAQLLSLVRDAVGDGVDPANVIFEITETAAIRNLGEARDYAGELAEIGCDLAIDDFGTGFGSLTYLKHMPSRYVKIDQEFIRELTNSSTDRQLVIAVVGIARSLGKLTVAEGVEDAATLQMVCDLGVDYVQGFYTGRPEPIWPAGGAPRGDRAATSQGAIAA